MKRATVVGVGLIGGSIAAGLREAGWHVSGVDIDEHILQEAKSRGVIDAIGDDENSDVTFVCVPVGFMPRVLDGLLVDTSRVITDVASTKAPILSYVNHPNFVAGHPMAGSEQDGVEHSRSDLFTFSTWILCPSATTSPEAFAIVQTAIADLQANMVAISPQEHDELVASISHLPHVVACTLMTLAVEHSQDVTAPVLRLAGGGFRDMTRIAAGHPNLWADILLANHDAIVEAIDRLQAELDDWKTELSRGGRSAIAERLARARMERRNLPVRGPSADQLAEIRIPIPDRPGVLAEVTTLAGIEGINISDIEISHDPEGERGLLLLLLPITQADQFVKKLHEHQFNALAKPLE